MAFDVLPGRGVESGRQGVCELPGQQGPFGPVRLVPDRQGMRPDLFVEVCVAQGPVGIRSEDFPCVSVFFCIDVTQIVDIDKEVGGVSTLGSNSARIILAVDATDVEAVADVSAGQGADASGGFAGDVPFIEAAFETGATHTWVT